MPISNANHVGRLLHITVGCLVLLCPSVQALTILNGGYNPDLHNRFEDWENGNYAANPNVPVSSLTGIGWGAGYGNAEDVTYAAITNQHIIGGHSELAVGATIYFHGDNGIISRTVQSAELIGGTMRIYTLDSPILDSSFQPIPIFTLGTAMDFASMEVAMFGQNGRVVTDQLQSLIYSDGQTVSSPFAYTDGNTYVTSTDLSSVPEGTTLVGTIEGIGGRYESGDSNSAVLGFYNGQWGLLGTSYLTSPTHSYFDLLPAYYQNLPDGVHPILIAVPEPSKWMFVLLGLTCMGLARNRRR